MIKFLLYKFFKVFHKLPFDFDTSKFIFIDIDPSIINELRDKYIFLSKWRASLNYSLNKENYKILKIDIIKEDDYFKVKVKIQHSFTLSNSSFKSKSIEIQNYLIIMTRTNYKWYVLALCDYDLFPSIYENLLFKNSRNLSFSSKEKLYKSNYWKDKIDNIDKLLKSYKDNFIVTNSNNNFFRTNIYNSSQAIYYARTYALNYNKQYNSFSGIGGDCTNFVSQCVHAGGIPLSYVWKPYSNPWIRVHELYSYLLRMGHGIDITKSSNYSPGCIVQFYANTKGYYSHSGILTEKLTNGDYLYCCHSYDKLDYPLSEMYPLFYDRIRVIKLY